MVSVVMSCYNAQDTVDRAVQSILDQTFRDFEFIVIDDGSSDQTLDKLKDWASQDNRIVIIQNTENVGLAESLNKGIKQAKGLYIARMDADDWAFDQRLERQVAFLEDHPTIDILGSAVINVSEEGQEKGEAQLPEMHDDILSRVFRKTIVFHPTVMLKRDIYLTYGMYDPQLRWAEDADLWYRIYDKVKFHNLKEPLLYYTVKSNFRLKHARQNLNVKIKNLKKRGLLLRYSPQLAYDVMNYVRKMIL